MANSWFRLYSEFATDPKVQSLSESLQRRYIMLLCLKSNGDLKNVTERNENVTLKIISTALRITEEDLKETKQELIDFGFIDDCWNINGWAERQYVSDIKDPSNNERQKRYREKKRNENKKNSNGTVTEEKRPDTDTDTDTDKRLKEEKIPFENFYEKYPIKKSKEPARKKWNSFGIEKQKSAIEGIGKYLSTVNDLNYAVHPSTYLNQERWSDEQTPNSAMGGASNLASISQARHNRK